MVLHGTLAMGHENPVFVNGLVKHRIVVGSGQAKFGQPGYVVPLVPQRGGNIRIEHLIQQNPPWIHAGSSSVRSITS